MKANIHPKYVEGRRAGVQRLGHVVGREPAALENDDAQRPRPELVRDGDPGRAGAYHAEIGVDQRTVRDCPGVEQRQSAATPSADAR